MYMADFEETCKKVWSMLRDRSSEDFLSRGLIHAKSGVYFFVDDEGVGHASFKYCGLDNDTPVLLADGSFIGRTKHGFFRCVGMERISEDSTDEVYYALPNGVYVFHNMQGDCFRYTEKLGDKTGRYILRFEWDCLYTEGMNFTHFYKSNFCAEAFEELDIKITDAEALKWYATYSLNVKDHAQLVGTYTGNMEEYV